MKPETETYRRKRRELSSRAVRSLALVVFGIVAVVAFVVLLGSGRASALGD